LKKGYADPNKICIAGWSYGGYASLMGAIKNSDIYKCAISMAGVTDLKDMIGDMKKYRFGKIAAKDFILKGFEDKDAIKENSPVKRADEINIPLFLAHGTYDQRVHFDQFKRMKSALKKSSAKVTYMTFKDEDHFLSDQENRQKFFKGMDKFLKEVVGESEFSQ
jgi:dipeptidyl aminopeptidase/acylaminoacyl peptidase